MGSYHDTEGSMSDTVVEDSPSVIAKRERVTPRGIVGRVDPAVTPKSGDETFSPDYTVTSTTDNGGQLLPDVEVILCFWGSFWSSNPPPTPSSDDYKQAIEGILTGPYLGGLSQY